MCVSTKAAKSLTVRLTTKCWFLYQIRAKRVGRQRLFTKQAWIKNRAVLLVMKATVVAVSFGMVMLVFNFFLRCLVKTSDKRHPVLF